MNETRRYSCRPVNTGINQSNTDFRKDTACRSTRSSIIHNLRSSHIDNSKLKVMGCCDISLCIAFRGVTRWFNLAGGGKKVIGRWRI